MSLLAPLFLLGLLGAFLPVALHRLQQQQAPEQDFPSRQFLQSTRSNNARRRKIRFWSLLLLRLLALALLCFLFAQPYLNKERDPVSEGTSLHLLVLDASYSMQYAERWSDAIEIARESIGDLAADQRVQLLTFGSVLREQTSLDDAQSVVISRLDELEPGIERAEFAILMQSLDDYAAAQSLPVTATFVTDAQRNATPANLNALATRHLLSMQILSVASTDDHNIQIQAAADWTSVDTIGVTANVTDSRHAMIDVDSSGNTNDSTEKPESQQLQVVVTTGTRELARKDITVSANTSQIVNLPDLELQSGGRSDQIKLEVSLQRDGKKLNDGLESDDTARLLLEEPVPTRIVMVAEDPQVQERDVIFVTTALTERNNLQVEELPNLAGRVSDDTDLVVFFSRRGQAEMPVGVEDYLQRGGNVLQVIDVLSLLSSTGNDLTQSSTDSNSTTVVAGIGSTDLVTRVDTRHALDFDLNAWADVSIYSSIDPGSTGATGGTPETLLRQVAQRLSVPSSEIDLLLASNRGLPVLMETGSSASSTGNSSGQGTRMILGLPLDGYANDLPLNPVFVPFMYKLLDYFLDQNAYPAVLAVGSSINLPGAVQLLSPDNEPLIDISAAVDGQSRVLDQPGIYTVLERSGSSLVRVIADPSESDMLSAGEPQLAAWSDSIAIDADAAQGDNSATASTNHSGDSEKQRLEFWRWLLPLLAAAGLLELFYSNWTLRRYRGGV